MRQAREEIVHWGFRCVIAALSITFALLLPEQTPEWLTGMPGITYGQLGLTGLVSKRCAHLLPAERSNKV